MSLSVALLPSVALIPSKSILSIFKKYCGDDRRCLQQQRFEWAMRRLRAASLHESQTIHLSDGRPHQKGRNCLWDTHASLLQVY
jgi:hypothetical protein